MVLPTGYHEHVKLSWCRRMNPKENILRVLKMFFFHQEYVQQPTNNFLMLKKVIFPSCWAGFGATTL